MYHYYQPLNKIAQDAAMYDLFANYYKYLDPQKHMHYYQLHFMCMQQLCQAQNYMQPGVQQSMMRSPSENNERARIRVLHAAPEVPTVDIYVNGEKALDNMYYYQISKEVQLPEGTYVIDIYPAGQTANRLLSETVEVRGGRSYTIAAAGLLEDLQLVTVTNTRSIPANQAKVRFWHLSPNAPAVDIAVANGDVLFSNVSFTEATRYLELDPGTATLEVRVAGTDDVVLTLRNTALRANQAYTITAFGLVGGTPRLEALILEL